MFTRRITLCRLFGIAIHIDMSWLLIAGLVIWSFATNYFPQTIPHQPLWIYLLMGAGVALGLLFSIIFHEMAHCIVAKQQGIVIQGITLFLFGGVAEMESEPPSPQSEFLMTIAGPLASLFLAIVFWFVSDLFQAPGWGVMTHEVLSYIMVMNFSLAIFNMIPAFPLDGGRILRSLLWWWKGSLRWATGIATSLGSGFGIILIVAGMFLVIQQKWGGIWWILIGMFVRYAAQMSYQQMLVRRGLEGEPVRKFMREKPVTVPPNVTLRDFVENYVYRHHYKMFPVVDGGKLLGCVTTSQLKEVPPDQWGAKTVADILQPCSDENTIGPDADAMKALTRMNRNRVSRLMIVENGQLRGILSLKDLLDFLSLKIELEEE
jgi:Zn-dependent protease/CBS domain-containing protein